MAVMHHMPVIQYLYISFFLVLIIACQGSKQDQGDHEISQYPVIRSLTQLIEQHPEDPILYYQRGEEYLNQGQYQQAISDFETVLGIDPNAFPALHLLADAYLDNLQSRKALETMERTVQQFPDSLRSKLKLAEFQHILKRYPDALETIQSIQDQDADNPDAFFMKGLVLKEIGDTAEAVQQFQYATRDNPFLVDAWINLGQLLEAQGNPDAIRYFDAGLEVDPDNLFLLHAKAQYLGRSNQTEEAKKTYGIISKLDPDYSEAYYDLGLILLDQDSLQKALSHFKIAIQTDPRFQRAYFYAGLTNEILDRYDEAQYYFSQAENLDPDDQDTRDAIQRVGKMLESAE